MNDKFDELTKGVAQSVTRRAALKKFGIGLAGMALACLGLANKLGAATNAGYCVTMASSFEGTEFFFTGVCVNSTTCQEGTSSQCSGKVKRNNIVANTCDGAHWTGIDKSKRCAF
jgi:hypothetical protein